MLLHLSKDYRVSCAYHWIRHSLNCSTLRYVCWLCWVHIVCIHMCANKQTQIRSWCPFLRGFFARCLLISLWRPVIFYFQRSRQLHDVAKIKFETSTSMKGITVLWRERLMRSQWWCRWRLSLTKFSLKRNCTKQWLFDVNNNNKKKYPLTKPKEKQNSSKIKHRIKFIITALRSVWLRNSLKFN